MPQGSTKTFQGPTDFEAKPLEVTFPETLEPFWNGGSPHLSYFFNALGFLSPSFERLFILAMLNYRREVRGTTLEEPVKAFLKQEAHHEHQIRRFNQTLEKQGYAYTYLEKTNLAFCKALNKRCSPALQLAMTMGAEHIIAVLSDLTLRQPLWFEQAPKPVAALWRWHAIEEIEHKSVAFDVYHAVNGSYWTKAFGMVIVSTVIGGMWARIWFHCVLKDKAYMSRQFWKELFPFNARVLGKLIRECARYFHPKFHPWQHDNANLIQAQRAL